MTVWGVCTVKDDADVIAGSMRNLLDQGVEHLLISDGMSTDGTREAIGEVAEAYPLSVTMFDDTAPFHQQPKETSRLARVAFDCGATWVVPWDADEFWIATDRTFLTDALLALPDSVGVVEATMWQHHDWERRELAPKPLPKVAFRAGPEVWVHEGNHSVSGVAGTRITGVLEVREIQYRSFEQFCQKITARNATIDPGLSESHGWHHKRYAGHTVTQLREAWDEMRSVPTITDPIW